MNASTLPGSAMAAWGRLTTASAVEHAAPTAATLAQATGAIAHLECMREAIIMRARYRTVDDLVAETHDNFEQLGQRDSRVSSEQ